MPVGYESFRLEWEHFHRHLGHDAEASAQAGIAAEQSAQIRADAVAPEPVIADSKRSHPQDFAVRQYHLGSKNAAVRQTDPVAERRPAVADQVGNHGSLRAAAADHDISAASQAFFLKLRVDNAAADNRVPVLFVKLEIVQAFQIDEEFIIHMAMRTGPVKSRAVRNVRDRVAIADLDDLLNFFGRLGQDDCARYFGHHFFIAQACFIPRRAGPVSFADDRVVRQVLGAYNSL